jgi:hypothetical protein
MKRRKMHIKNEGISYDVAENKGAVWRLAGITLNV